MNKLELQIMANEIRKDIITSVHSAKAGHPGGSLSAADVFTYLYFEEMNIDRTGIVLYFQKDIRRLAFMQLLHAEDIFRWKI